MAVVLGVIVMAMSSMLISVGKENRGLSEKLSSLDLQRAVTQSISNGALCSSMFNSGNLSNLAAPIDSTNFSPQVINLKSIPTGPTTPPLAALGEKASSLSQTLVIDNAIGSIKVLVTSASPPMGKLILSFDQSNLVRPLKNLEFPLQLTFSGPANAKTVVGCAGSGGGTPTMMSALLNMTTLTVEKGNGIASVVPYGSLFRVTFTNPMPDLNYTVILTPRGQGAPIVIESNIGGVVERTLNDFKFGGAVWSQTKFDPGYPDFVNVLVIP